VASTTLEGSPSGQPSHLCLPTRPAQRQWDVVDVVRRLRHLDNISCFRCDDPIWEREMQRIVTLVVEKVTPLLYPNGGPIIMQVCGPCRGGQAAPHAYLPARAPVVLLAGSRLRTSTLAPKPILSARC
jgi:hypothetical protein